MNEVKVTAVESTPDYLSDALPIPKLSQERLDKLGKKCLDRLNALKQERTNSNWEGDKQDDFNAYHLVPPSTTLPYEGYPNLACPLPRIGVDTFHANVLFTFCGQEGRFNVLPDYLSKTHMDIADRQAKYMSYVLNYESDAFAEFDKADMDSNKYKVGYLKAYYVKEQEWVTKEVTREEVVPEINELDGTVTRKTVKRKKKERVLEPTFDGIKIRRIAPESVFVSPFFETVKDAVKKDFLFEVGSYSFRYIDELSKSADEDMEPFFNESAVKRIKDFQTNQVISEFERTKQDYDGFQVERKVELMPIELAEAHFHEDVNKDGLSEKISVIFETSSGIVLRASWSKCRIVKLCPRPIDGRWDGESIRQAIKALVLEWEAIHNQRVAKGQWANLPFFFYKAGGRFNPQMLTLSPGRGYPVDDPSSIAFPQIPSPDMSYFQEERLLMDLIDRILALGDVIQGIGNSGNTATETIHSQQRAGIRLATPMNRIAGALNELMGHIWELNRECAPKTKQFKIAGIGDGAPEWMEITRSDYDVMTSFKLKMATMYDVQMMRDTALLAYQQFIANPLFQQDPNAFYALTKDTMTAMGINIPLTKPEQAKVLSPWLVIDMVRGGRDDYEPLIGTDADEHMRVLKVFMDGDEFKDEWAQERKVALMSYFDKLQILKETLQSANLNQAGMFVPPQGGMPPQPGMTASRNPSQAMNTMRVGETGKSRMQNTRNGQYGGDK